MSQRNQSLRRRMLASNLTLVGISVVVLAILLLLGQRSALKQQLELRALRRGCNSAGAVR